MKKIILTLSFTLAAFFTQAQEVTPIEVIQSSSHNLSGFVAKDISYLKELVTLSAQEQKAMEELLHYKYSTLAEENITGDTISAISSSLMERMKIVLKDKYTTIAQTENAVPYLSGRIYILRSDTVSSN